MPDLPYEDVEIEGHLIDSLMMPQIMDEVMDLEGEFEMLAFEVGRMKDDPSHAVMRIYGRDAAHLDELLTAITAFGVVAVRPQDAVLEPADMDGVFPDAFYSTTNLPTFVRVGGEWVRVDHPEMDCGIRVDPAAGRAETVAMNDVRAGDLYVTGHRGIRVLPLERSRESQPFEFMASAVSSEKPKAQIVHEVANILRQVRDEGRLTIAVVGPAVVHTGAAPQLARLIETGYVGCVFGGNAIATHDIESNLFGTSLGINLASGAPVAGGHEHHLRAINTIRRAGGIRAAVDKGVLTGGLMYTLTKTGTPYVLAGSIRDDGPMPEVVTDVMRAQAEMRRYAQQAGACLMLSTMLHSIAVGNMLPASVRTVCADINPAVVTKLADRGSFQAIGIVTDVGLFVGQLADELAR
ncbi:MAG TPA: TIGR00300 family protein [Thermoleophilia bacterium]|jgi:lysine-ketoglutarate reductase/saccharopine dehydrogenase-like protein (TIGR00300 family)|nr:TIGR00300 family protein [Acidobacteriota bacterium]HOU28525.1 TIGR00300 family protein [Thermoleophilia bacterium]